MSLTCGNMFLKNHPDITPFPDSDTFLEEIFSAPHSFLTWGNLFYWPYSEPPLYLFSLCITFYKFCINIMYFAALSLTVHVCSSLPAKGHE